MRGGGRLRRQPAQVAPAHTRPADLRRQHQGRIITRWDLSIQEDDFQAVLSLAEPMYLHAVHILSFLPANEVKNRGMADQERLFITLDTGFTYQSLLEEAEKLKIPKNTACSCLQRWQKQGIVRKGEKTRGL